MILPIKNDTHNNTKLIFFLGCIIGFIVFISIFTISPLIPTNDFFCSTGFLEYDSAQHYAGWMLYRQSPWGFPLGISTHSAFPYGTSVSYTDSIPLFSIFFKILSPILPSTFQFFGLFVAMSYSLMGGFSAILMNLFVKNFYISGLSALLFSLSPIMMERAFRHTALSAHFLIIACLYYYFKNKGNWNLKTSIPLIIINTLAISIHPYFLPFTFGISFAVFLEWSISQKQFLKAVSFLSLSLVCALTFGYIIGAFYSLTSASDTGFSFFSLNLNSYINPSSKGIEDWSLFLDPLPAYSSFQVEAFNYLGLGILLALILAFLSFLKFKDIRKEIVTILTSSYGLIFSAIALTLFALTNVITFNETILFSFNIPDSIYNLCAIFRASGRFGWLLHYLFYIVAIFCISKLKIKYIPYIILVIIPIIQIIDLYPAISSKNDYFKNKAPSDNIHTITAKLDDPFWDEIENFDSIMAITSGSSVIGGSIELASFASRADNDITVNINFEARSDAEKKADLVSQINFDLSNGNIDESTLYLADFNDINPLLTFIESGEYQAFIVNDQLIVFKARYTENQIEDFLKSDTFELFII